MKKAKDNLPRLYRDLAGWFHLLTAPEDYKEEAEFYQRVIRNNSRIPVIEVLEMGSGGGNNASHMKESFKLTLTDISEDMLAISRRLNPECEHIRGDMRSLRLKRKFDSVFVQDAVSHLTTINDLALAVKTAFIHCKKGGVALFAPDCVREMFKPLTQHGGHDGGKRSMRYLEWTWDPDATDTTYFAEFAYLFKENNEVHCEHERFTMGLFSKDDWQRLLTEAGFTGIRIISYPTEINWTTPVFIGIRPEK
jgi:ubiquinone/menaquinone biosynthesis C-methylase UbiE